MKYLFTLIFIFFSQTVLASPFIVGEKLNYNIYWSGIKAGSVILEVLPPDRVINNASIMFKARLETTYLIDSMFPVRQQIFSFGDDKLEHSLGFSQIGNEGKHNKNIIINFDWDKQQFTYISNGKIKSVIDIPKNTQDILSIFYFLRLQNFELYKPIKYNFTDGKKIISGIASVDKDENIMTDFGNFDSFLITPKFNKNESFAGKLGNGNLKIWISKTGSHLPLKISCKTLFGEITAELTQISGVSIK